MAPTWDVIVVGARAAGAATAMLLARAGLRVLAVDQASFPSDTLSSHQVQVPGVSRLARWGLLDALAAAGTPPTRRVRFDAGDLVLEGCFPPEGGVDALYSPRRRLLDALLVDAARAAGAEVRENVRVKELTGCDGVVTGIAGVQAGRTPVRETGRLVVGADGKHSLVARMVGAGTYRGRPAASIACYGYWSGLALEGGELYQRAGLAVAAFPTNDDLAVVFVAVPSTEFDRFRRDIEGSYVRALHRCGDLGDRVRGAIPVERLRTTPDLPNAFRVPSGPGWALVGDAGVVMDPVSAQGIGNAFRDAELLAQAIEEGLGGTRSLDASLAEHWRLRDAAVIQMYELTMRLATYRPPGLAERLVLRALAGRQAEIDRFLGVFAGTVPPRAFFGPANVLRLVGARIGARIAAGSRAPMSAAVQGLDNREGGRGRAPRPASSVERPLPEGNSRRQAQSP